MLFPVQVFPYNIICEIELLSHRMGFYWNVNTRQVYVSLMFCLPKITLLTVTVTFKQQPNFNSMNICYFDWRTFKLDAFNLDLILVCVTLLISNVAYCWSHCHATQFKGMIEEQVFHWAENVIFIKVNFKKKI